MTRGFRDEDTDESVSIADCKAVGESAAALRVLIRGESTWIPKSQITDDSEVYEMGGEGKLVITGWFANKEGLE